MEKEARFSNVGSMGVMEGLTPKYGLFDVSAEYQPLEFNSARY